MSSVDIDGPPSPEGSPKDPIFGPRKRACDTCRLKKVRCSQEEPTCQNCRSWKVRCTYSARKQRPTQNAAVSKTLEDVDNRLSRIEAHMFQLTDLLQKNVETEYRFGKQASSFSPPADIHEQPGKPETFLPPALITDANGRTHFVGVNSILQMITEAESNVKSKAFPLLRTSSNSKSRPIVIGVEDRDKLQLLADDTFETTDTNIPRNPVQKNEAIRVCKFYFDHINKFFPLFDEENFFTKLQKTYEEPAILRDQAWFVCYSMLLTFGMFLETQGEKDHPNTPLIGLICGAAWKTLSSFPSWPPSVQKVQALVAGAYVAQETARPGLVCSLISFACKEAQAIGLQRDCDKNLSLSVPERRDRKIAFWALYVLDKSMSLISGRAFSLPDFDIDVPYPEASCIWWPSFKAWINLAEIQGQIFQELYSAKGLRIDPTTRRAKIQKLDRKLREWWVDYGENAFFDCGESGGTQLEYAALELKFNYRNTLVMLHRVSHADRTGSTKSVCIIEARNAITSIKTAIADTPALADNPMLLWLVLFYTFASFFTLFSHAIERPSASGISEDLGLMEYMIELLGNAKYRNVGAQRLQRVARVFLDVAKTVTNLSRGPTTGTKRKRKQSNVDQQQQHQEPLFSGTAGVTTQYSQVTQLGNPELEQIFPLESSPDELPWEIRLSQPVPKVVEDASALSNDMFSNMGANYLSRGTQSGSGLDQSQELTNLNWMMWDQSWPVNLDDGFFAFQ